MNVANKPTQDVIETSAEKTKLMSNNANGIQREMKVKEQKLGIITNFKIPRISYFI